MNPELKRKLWNWLLLAVSATVATYVVISPFVWFACTFWVGMGYRESVPPPTEVLDAQIWREFIRANLRLPLALWPWFVFLFGVITLGAWSDLRASRKTQL